MVLGVRHPISEERLDLLLLESFDLRAECLEDEVDEADQWRRAHVLREMKGAHVTQESSGRFVRVTDRPQVQGEESLRPAVSSHRDRNEVRRVVVKEAHGVEMSSFGVDSVAVIVELVARSSIEDPAVSRIEPPRHERLPVSHHVDHVRAVPLQVFEKPSKLEDCAHRSA
jgi:hypothetical protein